MRIGFANGLPADPGSRPRSVVADLLAMGGHGAYVWSAYAISSIALAGICIWPLARMRSLVLRLRRRLLEEERGSR